VKNTSVLSSLCRSNPCTQLKPLQTCTTSHQTHTAPHPITPHHTTSHHITPHHITLHHTAPHPITPHRTQPQITAEGEYSSLCTFLETLLTMVWYPTTVATLSRRSRDAIAAAFEESVEGGAGSPLLQSRLHDFGFRWAAWAGGAWGFGGWLGVASGG